ncbi:HK97 family phage prohead protease [Deinococcus irradiatisoli]|uniref:HK97 family phage prohead protease n=1 Tax=Deinococcus irradiatisoli TaxID=2202254 RepID=A0A2Z3JKH0_9DEIO|nr:HK97 family phage prohead protease [Deinococcus irradiatisoli]AWN24011.1 HK97 family phage prohead protease [Deinococcus irradiatisoli]
MTKPPKSDASPEVKSLSVEFKAEPEGVITAYAAVFGSADSYGDVIQKGAFSKTIAERKDKIKVLVNHDGWSRLPVGKPLSMEEDNYGLLTTTKMSRTQMGQDIYTLASEGAISELSIGYYALKAIYPDDDASRAAGIYRYLNEIRLEEYSFLAVPSAHPGAVITGIKSGADLAREIKRWTAITEVNFSTKAGRVLSAANAKKILTALSNLQDLVTSAGLDTEEEAADGTSEADAASTDASKSSREPPVHSPLLTALQQKARQLETEGKGAGLLADLRRFGKTLGGAT